MVMELKSIIKQKSNIFLLLSSIAIVLISYYSIYLEKQEWVSVLNSRAGDVDLQSVEILIKEYTGLFYLERFFSSEYYTVLLVILIMGFGVIVGSNAFNYISNGFGNLVVTRQSYKKHVGQLLLSQTLYMVLFITAFCALVTSLSMLLIENGFMVPSGSVLPYDNMVSYLGSLAFNVASSALMIILIVNISSLCTIFFYNKYIIQILPLGFFLLPLIIGSTLGNINVMYADISSYVSVYKVVEFSFDLIKNNYNPASFISVFLGSSIFFMLFGILLSKNIKVYSRDYLI